MALLYPWATKEYLLWEMTIGQIVMYHNLGIELKYPAPSKNSSAGGLPSLKEQGYAEAKRRRDELRKLRQNPQPPEVAEEERKAAEAAKAPWREKYGNV